MNELTKLTDTQLLKLLTENKEKHDKLKEEIILDTNEFDEYILTKGDEINKKINNLKELEKKYINLLEELNNRNVIG